MLSNNYDKLIDIGVTSIHFQKDSSNKNVSNYKDVVEILNRCIGFKNIVSLNFGGSLPIYSKSDFFDLVELLSSLVPNHVKMIFEPGAIFSIENGYAIGSITDVKLICLAQLCLPQLTCLRSAI